jgi:tetratricopeptide (TPR) repeat protein
LALLYLRGKVEYGLGKKTEAEHDLTAAFSGAPQQANYALDLGLYYLQQHAYDQAARVLERGATLNPQSPFLHLGLSLAQFLGGRDAQSLESAQKLLKVQPDFSPAFLLAAFVLDVNGKLEDAEKVAAQGLARPRPTPYLYYLHATILVKLESKDYDRILKELALAGREIPGCGLCSLTASKAHEAQGNFPAATADLKQAVRFAPDYADAWYRLASLYDRVGRKADAAQARIRFERLKAGKEDRETDMLRKVFLQTLSGEGQSAASQ